MVSQLPVDLDGVDRAYVNDQTATGLLIRALSRELRIARKELQHIAASEAERRPALGYGDAYLSDCLQLSTRVRNILLRHRLIETVYELSKWSDAGLLGLRGFGPGCLDEVHDLLDEYGLR